MSIPFPVRAIPAVTFRAWLTPPPIGERALERDRAAMAGLTPFLTAEGSGFEVGSGPLALAVHGWGGRPAQLVPVARSLAEAGLRVVVPRLPGHAGGGATDIKHAAASVREIVDSEGEPELVVAHSFGAMVLRLAFADSPPHRMVLFAPALRVTDALRVFGSRARLLPWARRGLRRRLEAWDRELWPHLAELEPEQFPGTEMLLIHDPDDADTPFRRSAELAALRPGTRLHVAPGTGHSRVLEDEGTLAMLEAWARAGATAGA